MPPTISGKRLCAWVSLLVLVLGNLVFEWTRLAPIKVRLLETGRNNNYQQALDSDRKADDVHAKSIVGQSHNSSIIHQWLPTDKWIRNCVRGHNETLKRHVYSRYKVTWWKYMLGDCIRADCSICQRSMNVSHKWSIAGEYWRHVCHESAATIAKGNLTFLEELFERYKIDPYPYNESWRIPQEDELVIHLRIGDVMDDPFLVGPNANVIDMLRDGLDTRHGRRSFYRNGIGSIREYLDIIQESGLSKVVLKGGSHKANVFANSRIYTGCLADAILRAGYNLTSVQVSGEDNPDQDFYYMAHAQHFVRATGGYSSLIASLVQRRGGTVWLREAFRQQKKKKFVTEQKETKPPKQQETHGRLYQRWLGFWGLEQ